MSGGGKLEKARADLTKMVMGRKGISGTAVGQKGGSPCLIVYTDADRPATAIPKKIRGFPVTVEKKGPFRAF